MKYAHKRELVEGLRELADFIEAHPELPIAEKPFVNIEFWCHENELYPELKLGSVRLRLAIAARAMGLANKKYSGGYFDVYKRFGDCVRLTFTANREYVCRKVVKEVVHHPERVIPARDEEVVEWVCDDALLA